MKLTFYPNSDKQLIASQAWQNDIVDDVVFGGAAGGGKTTWECSMLTLDAMRWPDTRYFIGRKELKRLMATTYITLTQEVFKKMGLKRDYHWRFDGKYSVVYLRQRPGSPWSTIDLLDLDYFPSDPLYDRFGSGLYTRGCIEEASEIKFRGYDIMRSRVGRYRNVELGIKAKLGIGLNPSDDWPYRLYYDPWKKAGRPIDPASPLVSIKGVLDGEEVTRTFVFIPVTAKENPDIGRDYRVNLATINDATLKARLADGDWEFSSATDVLFEAQGLADLYSPSVKARASEERFLTVDSARDGGDKIVRTFWKGWRAYKIKWEVRKKTPQTAETVRNDLESEGIPRENCLIDDPGGGVVDYVPGAIQFVGAASPFGRVGEMEVKEQYENLRTQCVYHFADQVNDRKVEISEKDLQIREWLAEDLKQFKKRDAEKDGKMKITKKEDMKAALGRSPDFADSAWMRSYFDLREKEPSLNKKLGTMTVVNTEFPSSKRKRDLPGMSVHIQD